VGIYHFDSDIFPRTNLDPFPKPKTNVAPNTASSSGFN
jgi:hypothetical protein